MNKKTLISFISAIVIIGIIWFAGAFTASSKQPASSHAGTTVKIAYLALVHGLPLYLAEQKGYFKDAGIEAELIPFQSPGQIIDALLQGKVDFTSPGGATGIVAIANSKNPGKLNIYALAGGNDVIQNDSILVKNDSAIKSVKDLKGKKIGILTGSIQWQTIAKKFLAQNELTVGTDVTLVDLPINLQAQALASGQIDALIAIEPIPTVIKEKGIGRELVDHFTAKYIADPFYGGAGIVRSDFAKENPEAVTKVLSVFSKSIDEINQNPDAARQYMKKYLTVDDAVIAKVPVTKFTMYDKLTTKDIHETQKFMDIFPEFKVVDAPIDFKALIYSPSAK